MSFQLISNRLQLPDMEMDLQSYSTAYVMSTA